ncbi:terminase ATPase subunit family protein [Ewingella americana]|uniref:Phage terminase, ATPase subunit n=1 Tax=Ewingella americana (strain ATCC 33852 / DSM 4580 / CCUG 14506 / JCM 5911 / LMG 7869 / NCTC 12157 / CDC 1468-78) TaxID=910964 RepID=A0A085GQ44_EWIA3|nr:terminase ATPase subunit family protein [Ewingella americana]KAA8727991.1 terminase ATPase subunit family protein [Ewingella americana]KFC85839.1 phage terminase, ATPase subunit [Ewingella americana ATCC 33852]
MKMTNSTIISDPRRQAALLYWQGFSVRQIAELLTQKIPTVQSWKTRDAWDNAAPISRVESSLEARLIQLVTKDVKGNADYKEIDALGRMIERLARVNRYSQSGNEVDLNPNFANRNKGERKKPTKNYFSDEALEKLEGIFLAQCFQYQRVWYDAGLKHRIRDILKSRQIGATFFFAREALLRALATGHNQIFLSASKTQAYVFREYIIQFARQVDVELTGDPIVIGNNGAKLIFLGTNSNTAQSHNGDLYVDEIFWIPNFQKLRKVASGMASQEHLRTTYFSTPSALTHGAYPFWSGELFNKGREDRNDRIELDISHHALAKGQLCGDGQWRQIVTIEDALAGGCNLFNIDTLKQENSAEDFRNLFMCEFVDDQASVFPFVELQRCMVESAEEWEDFSPFATRPFGYRAVWIGYDPSHTGDSAGCAVLAPPLVDGGKFRVLERHQWKGMDFAAQAKSIEELTKRYCVEYIGIDATGIGQGVFQLVRQFFPAAMEIRYSPETKTKMVLKAKDTITSGRLEYDTNHKDITSSFMAIRKTMTASGSRSTYEASRSEEASHADVAWAIMHALLNEPLTAASGGQSPNILEFY